MKLRRHRMFKRHPNLSEARLAGFDADYYLASYPDVRESGCDPIRHYLEQGWKEGRDPSAGFSTLGYLAANQDVAAAGINPLVHFVQIGLAQGRVGFAKDPKSAPPQPSGDFERLWTGPVHFVPGRYGMSTLQGAVDEIDHDWINGWALGVASPNSPAEIEIYVEKCLVGTVIASTYRPDLAGGAYGSGHHGFTFKFLPSLNPFVDHKVTVQRAVDKLVILQTVVRRTRDR